MTAELSSPITYNPKSISEIYVKNLFGTSTYHLGGKEDATNNITSLAILYGDNGSGKTTILRLLYSLLSTAKGRGHKSAIAETPFEEFRIGLTDGTYIEALRTSGQLRGTYTLKLKRSGFSEKEVVVECDDQYAVKIQDEYQELYSFLSDVSELDISLYYLSADRKVQSSFLDDQPDDIEQLNKERQSINRARLLSRKRLRASPSLALAPAIVAFEQWVQQQAISRSKIGDANSNTIYTEVIKGIVSAPTNAAPSTNPSTELIKILLGLSKRSETFAQFGLTSPLNLDVLIELLKTSPVQTQPIISSVLEPYISGIQARLDAMQEINDLLAKFTNNVNSLYSRKSVSFNLRYGLAIHSDEGAELSPEQLSSGEKQLLLLLCNTLVARDQTSIFIIDEPEISLNVKWQRRLVDTLLDCVMGSSVQFVLATHSIELLARHKQQVLRLYDLNVGKGNNGRAAKS